MPGLVKHGLKRLMVKALRKRIYLTKTTDTLGYSITLFQRQTSDDWGFSRTEERRDPGTGSKQGEQQPQWCLKAAQK